MSTVVNDRDVLLQSATTRLLPALLPDSLYLSVVRGLLLSSPGFNFQVDDLGNAAPASFLITATKKQVSGTVGFSVVSGAATLTGSGDTRTLSYTNVTTFPVTIRGTVVDSDGTTFTNEITFTKVTSAASSTSYWLTRSAGGITRNADGSFTPSSISFSGIAATGGNPPGAYGGRFVIATSLDGTTYTTQYTSAVDENTKNYTGWPAGTVTIRTQLYQAGGTTNLLDEEIVPIVASGTHGITVAQSNNATTVPALSTGVVSSYTGSGTQLQVFEGSTLLTFTTGTLAAGQFAIGTPVVSPAGKITVGAISGNGTTTATVAAHSAMDSATSSVTITYPITLKRADGTTITTSAVQTVTKAIGGATGTTGSTGARGALTIYASTKYGMTQTAANLSTWLATDADPYTGTGTVGGIDQYANRAVYNAINGVTGNVQLNSTSHLVIGDTVTIMDATTVASASAAGTKYWSGTGWVKPGLVIDGNLLVTGTLSASKINGGTITASDVNLGGGTFQISASDGYMIADKITVSVGTFGNLVDPTMPCITAAPSAGNQPAIKATAGPSGIGGPGTQAIAAYGSTASTAEAILGSIPSGNTSTTAHGLRGINNRTGSSGLVGPANAFDFYADGSGTNYGPFTGSHEGIQALDTELEPGDIVVDVRCIVRRNMSNTLFEVAPSTQPCQRGAVGVFVLKQGPLTVDTVPSAMIAARWIDSDGQRHEIMDGSFYENAGRTLVNFNAVGEGQINVCGEGGDIEVGDYIVTSSMPGKGMKQTPFVMTLPDGSTMQVQVLCNFTVAKAREGATFSSPGEVKTIACSYHSC
jgi:hypothetical protein